jgi:methionyl-tRNA formyltransferase
VKTKPSGKCIHGFDVGQVAEINHPDGIGVQTGKGILYIQEIKPEGKKPMSYRDFLNGRKINIGGTFA